MFDNIIDNIINNFKPFDFMPHLDDNVIRYHVIFDFKYDK